MTIEKNDSISLKMFGVGAFSGLLDAMVNHPLINATLLAHQGILGKILSSKNSSLILSTLYKGMLGSAGCMIPATAIQLGVNDTLKQLYEKHIGASPTINYKILISVSAGVATAFVITPNEHVLTKLKQHKEMTFLSMANKMIIEMGFWKFATTGLAATMFRFGVGTVCFCTGSPLMENTLKQQQMNPWMSMVMSGLFAGVVAAIITQPADRIKYTQHETSPKSPSIMQVIIKINHMGGPLNFFTACGPRILRVTSALGLSSCLNSMMATSPR